MLCQTWKIKWSASTFLKTRTSQGARQKVLRYIFYQAFRLLWKRHLSTGRRFTPLCCFYTSYLEGKVWNPSDRQGRSVYLATILAIPDLLWLLSLGISSILFLLTVLIKLLNFSQNVGPLPLLYPKLRLKKTWKHRLPYALTFTSEWRSLRKSFKQSKTCFLSLWGAVNLFNQLSLSNVMIFSDRQFFATCCNSSISSRSLYISSFRRRASLYRHKHGTPSQYILNLAPSSTSMVSVLPPHLSFVRIPPLLELSFYLAAYHIPKQLKLTVSGSYPSSTTNIRKRLFYCIEQFSIPS